MPWTIIERDPARRRNVFAKCDCGRVFSVDVSSIRNGHSTRCAPCARPFRRLTHGRSGTPEHRIWHGIVRRTVGEKDPAYAGVEIAKEWTGPTGFAAFIAHIGPRPGREYSVDRIDGTRGYEPGNVRWATSRMQNQNRKDNVVITHNGVTLCITEWARRTGIPVMTIVNRWRTGRSPEEALSVLPLPPRRQRPQESLR